ncbi:MAG: hypothetical protein IJ827_05645 [Lachnospiraceae bacterium]|nr:hypothetical protein [Lachnospiraceae bacterium]
MQSDQFLWEYSFDLIDAELQFYYGKASYKHGWQDAGEFLIAHGFDNKDDKQGSCYFTTQKMTPQKANAVIRQMFKELPWYPFCLRTDALTVREENVFTNKSYAERLTKSETQRKRLDEYYSRLGLEECVKVFL